MSSLPVPVSPSMSTVASFGEMSASSANSRRILTSRPTSCPNVSASASAGSTASSSGRNLMTVRPELDLGAEADGDLLEARALDEAAVGRAEVAHEHLVAFEQRHRMATRHRLVREHQIARRRRAERHRLVRQVDLLAAIRTFDDEEGSAGPLPREGRRLIENTGDVGIARGSHLSGSGDNNARGLEGQTRVAYGAPVVADGGLGSSEGGCG